jgi:hypothetical protein
MKLSASNKNQISFVFLLDGFENRFTIQENKINLFLPVSSLWEM